MSNMQNVDIVVAQAIENPEGIRTTARVRTCERCERRGAACGIRRIRSMAWTSRPSTDLAKAGLALIE
jgi:hypothetical protein